MDFPPQGGMLKEKSPVKGDLRLDPGQSLEDRQDEGRVDPTQEHAQENRAGQPSPSVRSPEMLQVGREGWPGLDSDHENTFTYSQEGLTVTWAAFYSCSFSRVPFQPPESNSSSGPALRVPQITL